jgi:hypothetical protein
MDTELNLYDSLIAREHLEQVNQSYQNEYGQVLLANEEDNTFDKNKVSQNLVQLDETAIESEVLEEMILRPESSSKLQETIERSLTSTDMEKVLHFSDDDLSNMPDGMDQEYDDSSFLPEPRVSDVPIEEMTKEQLLELVTRQLPEVVNGE